ncbi:Zinc finger protein 728 [Araneus ventricosus]|uniref:Zinc finger protein 728 n=1 Tax=Araneus ventricosus TaxID=182803 RepID=A0A4Y2R0R2_ARAVE|nr:Zinc finger protein 728 [Araneus ventricosus]
MSRNEERNRKPLIEFTLPTKDENMASENSSSPDTSGAEFRLSHESDGDFSALDLLLSSIWSTRDKPPQDVGVVEEERQVTRFEAFCDLENNPSTTLALNVPLNPHIHRSEQLACECRNEELCEDIPLEKIQIAESTEDSNDVGKLNRAYSPYFPPGHSIKNRYPGNIIGVSRLTERQIKVDNYSPKLPCETSNSSDSNNFSNEFNTTNSVTQQTGECSEIPTHGECSKNASILRAILLKQSRVIISKKVFICTNRKCQRKFTNKLTFIAHMQKHDEPIPYKCDQCSKKFLFKSKLREHCVVHRTEKPFKCDHCDYASKRENNLIEHIMRCHGSQLDAYFSKKVNMTSKRGLKCKNCTRIFTNKLALRIHMENHDGPNPHKCNQCPKKFSFERSLRKHYVVHSEEKPFKCDFCDYESKWKESVTRHIKRCHTSQLKVYFS